MIRFKSGSLTKDSAAVRPIKRKKKIDKQRNRKYQIRRQLIHQSQHSIMLPKGTRKRCDLVLRWKLENRKKKEKRNQNSTSKNTKCHREIEVMCASPSFLCVAVPRGIRLWRQNVAGRRSGRVTEHIKTHTDACTHTHTHSLPAGPTAATQKTSLWVPASHPHLLY